MYCSITLDKDPFGETLHLNVNLDSTNQAEGFISQTVLMYICDH